MTFSDYFSSTDSAEVILARFGYAHRIETLTLPSFAGDVPFLVTLKSDFRLLTVLGDLEELVRALPLATIPT